jgi:glycosyltransferase involved in cell wall biosynthesis
MFNDFFVFPNFFICPGTEWERPLTPDIAPRLTVVPLHITENRLREYVGDNIAVLTTSSNMTRFPIETRSVEYNRCVEGFPNLLTGRGNSSYPGAVMLDYGDYIEALAKYRVHLSNGYGRSARYAVKRFIIESMMSGAPVATLSNLALRQIFDNETNGFCSNDIPWLRGRIRELLRDFNYAKRVGKNGQALAKILWSEKRARKCWEFVIGHDRQESVYWLRQERNGLRFR